MESRRVEANSTPSPAGEGQPDTPINHHYRGEVLTSRIEKPAFISHTPRFAREQFPKLEKSGLEIRLGKLYSIHRYFAPLGWKYHRIP